MSIPSSSFEDALQQAVAPGPDRLLVGVAVAAATSRTANETSGTQDYLAAYGTIKLDPSSSAVTTKTMMWIASCTKLVTTIAAMQCVERGLFNLDEPKDVDRLLPEWKDPSILIGFNDDGTPIMQLAKEKITLRHLLTHTSGIAYDFLVPQLMQWRKSRGEFFLSYGGGLDVAGLMIARANKCTLEAYMRANIFDVLGMDETSFDVRHNKIGERLMPMATRPSPEEPIIGGISANSPLQPILEPADHFGGSGLFSNAEDYLKFLKSLLFNDGRLVKPSTVDHMFTPCISSSAQASLNAVLSIPQVAAFIIPGEAPLGTPDANKWAFGLGGIIALKDEPGRRKSGHMRWGGVPNQKWWVDREGGTCGVWATQLFPMGEDKHMHLTNDFVREVVGRFAK
ncbi:beta-lactamase/transpeptidase-like protein [Plenodomus tracheiphilus IPT5]|uniref:Beta-lactamase/transpeptidase-like protein n=1 Tax=Plenodomus tracheiphilus IPT5 TaxID=1408161 RepID=A0A6A7AVV8_9PLEO|nr:beta-lactamase/transpeptidase-like protein [Plenodomus tracheiphilus IPT5]